jgi:hypothetical protein
MELIEVFLVLGIIYFTVWILVVIFAGILMYKLYQQALEMKQSLDRASFLKYLAFALPILPSVLGIFRAFRRR